MASAPDKISIKRRRVDEPVDHLLYQGKKQRTANHIFVRVLHDTKQSISSPGDVPSLAASPRVTGVPSIRSTQPGDEIKDFQKYKASLNKEHQQQQLEGIFAHLSASKTKPDATTSQSRPRRFHLTRDLCTTALRPQSSGGIRKAKSRLRPHLPTFIERHEVANAQNVQVYAKEPIDRVIRTKKNARELEPSKIISNSNDVERQKVQTFHRSLNAVKTGRSINDDLATWDLESDQLATELAELAMEMDPSARATFLEDPQNIQQVIPTKSASAVMEPSITEEFVFETYIRVQPNALLASNPNTQLQSFGYLIIDEEEEELWEQYLRDDDDDDDEWDEEDEDSNAEENPRNEYPDEEVSSDDEYGRNIYKYRRDCSDDEQFDEDEP